MPISLRRIDPADTTEREALITFLTSNEFPFHVRRRLTREQVETDLAQGVYRDQDNDSYWIEHDQHGRVGLIRFCDLSDGNPLFDLRLDSAWRGKGLGAEIVRAATNHVFATMPQVSRFEAATRLDNIAMRRSLLRAGWAKEAHHREGWPVEGAAPLDSIGYAVLRRDWLSGETTPVRWDDDSS